MSTDSPNFAHRSRPTQLFNLTNFHGKRLHAKNFYNSAWVPKYQFVSQPPSLDQMVLCCCSHSAHAHTHIQKKIPVSATTNTLLDSSKFASLCIFYMCLHKSREPREHPLPPHVNCGFWRTFFIYKWIYRSTQPWMEKFGPASKTPGREKRCKAA